MTFVFGISVAYIGFEVGLSGREIRHPEINPGTKHQKVESSEHEKI